jgi:cytochrome P450
MLTINEDLLGPEAIDDPYTYYGRLREEDPIHWNPLYETWVITRYDDVVWFLRHPELFSSEIFLRDDRPPFPVWSKNSCGIARVVFQKPPEPFATPNRAFVLCVLVDGRKEQHIALALMIG